MRSRRIVVVTLALALLCAPLAPAADLSPGSWSPAERKHAEALQMRIYPPQSRMVQGKSAIISDTGSPIAVHAGIEALRRGGSAADAAATVALTEIATGLGAIVSYAGILRLVYFDAGSKKVYSLGAGWNSFRGETDPASIPASTVGLPGLASKNNSSGGDTGSEGRKTLVPGFMAGIQAMHRRFGKLPFADLFQPAIWYAENGVTVTPVQAYYFSSRAESLSRTPEGRLFLRQAGDQIPKSGSRFIQPALAQTLRGVSKHGAKYMYTGPWGMQFVSTVQKYGGKVTDADMAAYQPLWEEPVSTDFRGHKIFAPGGPDDGGRQILEALNFAEEMNLDQRPPYWKDPEVFSRLSRILQFVATGPYVTPEVTAFQQQHNLTFSSDDRISKAYAKAMIQMIDGSQRDAAEPTRSHHSAGVVVVDRWGNVAALVHSINASPPWGTTGIVAGGVPLSDAAGFQQNRLTDSKPGSRVPNEMAPVLVISDGKPVLAIAAVGASLIPETVRMILGVLGNHTDLATLLSAPPLLFNYEAPGSGESYTWKRQLVPGDAYDSDFIHQLQLSKVAVRRETKAEVLALRGTAAVATLDRGSGMLQSAECPAVIDFAEAY